MVMLAKILDERIKTSRTLIEDVKLYTNSDKVNTRLKYIVEVQQGIIEQLNERIKRLENNN